MTILQPSTIEFLKGFMSRPQLFIVAALSRGEERKFFIEKMNELAERIRTMPATYGQDGKGHNAIAYLHYFLGGMDWYITEKDSEPEQLQAMGVANLGPLGNGPELGYISLVEILAHGAELDFHFTPKPLKDIPKACY